MAEDAKALKMLEGISENVDSIKDQHKKEFGALTVAFKEATDKNNETVVALNRELGEKGATILQLQDAVKELQAKGGRIGSDIAKAPLNLWQEIREMVIAHKDDIAGIRDGKQFPVLNFISKAVGNISSANLTGDQYHTYLDWRPGMEPTGQVHMRDLLKVLQSDTDFVQFPRANTPVGEGSFARVAEGAAKPQVDRDYTMVDLTLKPMAGYAIVSRQSLRNIPFLQTWLPTSMLEQLLDAEDADFSGSLVAAATGSSTTAGITAAPERLVYLIKNLLVNKYSPNKILVDPAIWAALLVFRPGTDNSYSLPVTTVDGMGALRMLGREIIPVNWLTGGRIIAGDFNRAAIVQSEGLTLRQSDSHASTFVTNEITFLLERTEGLAVFRPDAFITTTLS